MTDETKRFDVFVSHSHADKAIADALVHALEGSKIRCWIAPRDILPGMNWSGAIMAGIEASRTLLLVFSQESNSSQQVLQEVERAVNRGLPILPVRIAAVKARPDLEFFIGARHWLDLITGQQQRSFGDVVSTVMRLLLAVSSTKEGSSRGEVIGPEKTRELRFNSGDVGSLSVRLRHTGLALPVDALYVELDALIIERRVPEGLKQVNTDALIAHLRHNLAVSDPVSPSALLHEAMRRGKRRCVLIRGDAGSGKSLLLKMFASTASDASKGRMPGSQLPVVVCLPRHWGLQPSSASALLEALPGCGPESARSSTEGHSSVLVLVDDLHLHPDPQATLDSLSRISAEKDVFVLATCSQQGAGTLTEIPPTFLDVVLCPPNRRQSTLIMEAMARAAAACSLGDPNTAASRAALWSRTIVAHADHITFDTFILAGVSSRHLRVVSSKEYTTEVGFTTPAYWAELADMLMHSCGELRAPYVRSADLGPPEDCTAFSYSSLSLEFLRTTILRTESNHEATSILEGACCWAAYSIANTLHSLYPQDSYNTLKALSLEAWERLSAHERSRATALLARLGYLAEDEALPDGIPKCGDKVQQYPAAWHLAASWAVRRLEPITLESLREQLISNVVSEGSNEACHDIPLSGGEARIALAFLIGLCSSQSSLRSNDAPANTVRRLLLCHPSFALLLLANLPRATMALAEDALVGPHEHDLSVMRAGPDYELRGRIIDRCLDWFGRGNLTAEFLLRIGDCTRHVSDLYFIDNALGAIGGILYGEESNEAKLLRHRLYKSLGEPGPWIAWLDIERRIPRWVWIPESWSIIENKSVPSTDGFWTFCSPVRDLELQDLCERIGDRRGLRANTWYDAVVFSRWVGTYVRGTLEGRLPTCSEILSMYEAFGKGHGCPIETAGHAAALELWRHSPHARGARGKEMSIDTARRLELSDTEASRVPSWSLGPFWIGVAAEQKEGLTFRSGRVIDSAWSNISGENARFRPVLTMALTLMEGYEAIIGQSHDGRLWLLHDRQTDQRAGVLRAFIDKVFR